MLDEEKNVSSELKEPKDFLQLMHPCLQIPAALWSGTQIFSLILQVTLV